MYPNHSAIEDYLSEIITKLLNKFGETLGKKNLYDLMKKLLMGQCYKPALRIHGFLSNYLESEFSLQWFSFLEMVAKYPMPGPDSDIDFTGNLLLYMLVSLSSIIYLIDLVLTSSYFGTNSFQYAYLKAIAVIQEGINDL